MLASDTRLKERYKILHKIGGGGFGYVYKAIDEVFGCSVAIKETREEIAKLDKLRKAFEREAKLLRNLKHESLPRVTDYFFQDQAQFLVMDFIEGEDLATLLKKRLQQYKEPFTCHEILPWADKILDALEYLHSRLEPIIHRDIKPSNIKLADDGGIYLLDFGLAKGVTGQMSTLTEGQTSRSVQGFTPEYAPLEQLQDTGTEPQSDIYALGATLYHLLTGQVPISASRRDEALQRGQEDPLRPVHVLNPAIPFAVSRVISQAMTVRWWDRTGSAVEMRSALKRACGELGSTQQSLVNQSVSRSMPLDSKDGISTLPLVRLNKTVSMDNIEPAQPLAQTLTPLRRLRRPWSVGLVLVSLVVFAIVARLAFLHWFAPAISTNQNTQATLSQENLKPRVITTPAYLSLKKTLDEHAGGHIDSVWSVAFSPDGSLAASASEDTNIILWDTKTWEPKFQPLTGHTGAVYSVAFSPDGTTLASGSSDKTIRLWNTQTGKLIKPLSQEHTKPILRLAFSPNGNFLASISGEPKTGGEEIRLWYARNDWKSEPLKGQSNNVFAIAFSPDGSTLVSAGYGKTLRLWHLRSDGQSEDLMIDEPRNMFVTTIAFSTDGKYMACGSSDKTIKLWLYQPQAQKWEESQKPLSQEHNDSITSIAFSPDNKTLVSASLDNTIRLWDVATGTSTLLVNPSEILTSQRSVAFSPDGQTLITGGKDKMVRVWQ
jgi:WD40 repeat protein/predicted Ser/Thr protein kinase